MAALKFFRSMLASIAIFLDRFKYVVLPYKVLRLQQPLTGAAAVHARHLSDSDQPEAGGRPGTPKISFWPKATNDLDCHSTMQSFDPHFSQNSWPVALSWSQLRYSYQTPCATPTHQRRCCQPQTKTRLLPPPPTARHQARHGIVFRPINLCPIDWCRRRETERARVRCRPPSLRVCSGDQSPVAACPVGTHGGCDAEGP